MKNIRLFFRIAVLVSPFLLLGCWGDKIEGTFYFSDEARLYQIDTTICSFKMIDNNGITEQFYMDRNIWYTTHHYFMEWGVDGKAFGETFGVAYISVLNDFFFMYVLRADIKDTDLEIEWNQRDRFVYNFGTKKVTDGIAPKIKFYDNLIVKGVSYNRIIEVDYTGKENLIDLHTPVKTFISGEVGLIKFIRKDNVVFERID
jgi:hypothetical protein